MFLLYNEAVCCMYLISLTEAILMNAHNISLFHRRWKAIHKSFPFTSWSGAVIYLRSCQEQIFIVPKKPLKLDGIEYLFVCVEVLRPSQPNGVMSSVVSLPNHAFAQDRLSPLSG